MHKKFDTNQTKIESGCQSGRKVVPHDSKSDLPLLSKESTEESNRNMAAGDQRDLSMRA